MPAFAKMSGLFMIVRRSLRQHALSTLVTVFSLALGSGLVMSVFGITQQSEQAFTGGAIGFDAVLGARGSKLQLVLNTVFHLETSPGNIPWEKYQLIKNDPRVALAIPYAVGDNYRGFRIVGTTREIFTDFEYQEGKPFRFARGEPFDPMRQEAVIGSIVADETGLGYGSKFQPYHGLRYREGDTPHEEEYVVVGVLEPTNTPSDRVIWIPIEGVFRIEGHTLRGTGEDYDAVPGEAIPDEHKEVSAVMLDFKGSGIRLFQLEHEINKQSKDLTLAWPIASTMADLFQKIGWITLVLRAVAYLVVAVAAGSVLASIYNTMNERRREFAILRSLGARRRTVFSAIVLESTVIAALGALGGYLVYYAIFFGTAAVVKDRTGVVLDLFAVHPALWYTPAGMVLVGAAAGLIPAFKAYSTDVASNLVPTS